MEEVKQFISHFIETEKKQEEALLKKDIDLHNNLAELIIEMSEHEIVLTKKRQLPLSSSMERYIAGNHGFAVSARLLYKISEYKHEAYGTLWACYVSVANPIIAEVKSISSALFVAVINGDLKIIALFNIDRNTDKWTFRGGDRTIQYYKLGKPTAIERLMSPEVDEWSIEEYNKNR
jgi:hypothetical protein